MADYEIAYGSPVWWLFTVIIFAAGALALFVWITDLIATSRAKRGLDWRTGKPVSPPPQDHPEVRR